MRVTRAQVGAVHVYPVKSTAGHTLAWAEVERSGLRHDRRWMVVDSTGEVVTARERKALLSVRATPDGDGGLLLEAPGRPALSVPVPLSPPDVAVRLSRLDRATDAGGAARQWFSALLGEPARLVWLDDPARRTVGEHHGGTGDEPLALADAGPLLLTTTASLAQLQEWVDAEAVRRGEAGSTSLVMARFRPNVVVDGDLEPFVEDGWTSVRLGDLDYRVAECCDRCVMTTIGPSTLQGGKEPIRTLARHRQWDGKTWFGIRLVPLGTGRLAVGDAVQPGGEVAPGRPDQIS